MRKTILLITCLSFLLINCGKKELKTVVEESYQNGAKKKEISYYDKPSEPRRVTIYFENGIIKSDQFFNRGLPDSTTIINFPDGKRYKEMTYIQQIDNRKTIKPVLNGKESYWYQNGQLKSETIYEKGVPVGKSVSYYEDGKKQVEVTYKDGKKDGEEKQWYPDGKEFMVVTYSNGNKNGITREWYSNGNLKKESTFLKDILDGSCKTWYENGKMESECSYKDGAIDGLKQEWDEKGKLVAKATYQKGEMIEGKRF